MVLIFSFVAAESLLMKFWSGPAQSVGGDGGSGNTVASSHKSGDPTGSNTPQGERPVKTRITQAGEASTSPPQSVASVEPERQGLLTIVLGSDLVAQTTDAAERVVETVLPVQTDLDTIRLLEQVQSGVAGDNETIKSLLSQIL